MALEWCPNCGSPIYKPRADGSRPKPASALWCPCETFADVSRADVLTVGNGSAPLALF